MKHYKHGETYYRDEQASLLDYVLTAAIIIIGGFIIGLTW